MKVKIIGLRIEKYVGNSVKGYNCKFTYTNKECERHILCCIVNNSNVEITLQQDEGQCGSGWCESTDASLSAKTVSSFNGITYFAKDKNLNIEMLPNFASNGYNTSVWIEQVNRVDEFANEVFYFSSDGGDFYYPCGYYNVNMDLFVKTIRAKEKRPVWIFIGESNIGKSYLSSLMSQKLTVYETDSNQTLPDVLTESIIVVGNKYKFDISDITKRIFGESEIIYVNFSK